MGISESLRLHLLKQELTTKSYSLKGRLRLFHGTVTPTMLYASSAWTITAELQNKIRRTQRQMLRMILNSPRRRTTTPQETQHAGHSTPTAHHNNDDNTTTNIDDDTSDSNPNDVDSDLSIDDLLVATMDDDEALEPWADWMRRCTHEAEKQMTDLGIQDWVSEQRRRKWRWARKVATDDASKWTARALHWDPTLDSRHNARRRTGRPQKRWTDDIIQHIDFYAQQQLASNDDDNHNIVDDNTASPHHNTTQTSRLPWAWQVIELVLFATDCQNDAVCMHERAMISRIWFELINTRVS